MTLLLMATRGERSDSSDTVDFRVEYEIALCHECGAVRLVVTRSEMVCPEKRYQTDADMSAVDNMRTVQCEAAFEYCDLCGRYFGRGETHACGVPEVTDATPRKAEG